MVDSVSASLPPATPVISTSAAPDNSAQAQTQPVAAVPGQKGSGSKGKEFGDHALDKIASRLVAPDSRLAIWQDNVIQRFIYKFVNPDSGKVLRQYPQQGTVDSMHAIEESYQRFLDEHA